MWTSPQAQRQHASGFPPTGDTAALPDTSTFYTLFPSTLPHGPPPHSSSSFTIDLPALRREFLALQSRFHPDKYDASSATHRQALALSSLINNAYRTLVDPLLRAQYLLHLRYGIDVTSEDNSHFQIDQATLMEVMDAQEAIEEAQSSDEVLRLKEENKCRMDNAIQRIGQAFEHDDKEQATRECVSGVDFTNLVLSKPDGPKLTLYVRNPSRLPAAHRDADPTRVRVVKGELNDQAALEKAMTDESSPVETVVSFLGAYVSLQAFLLRTTTTPIADSFPTIFAAMKKSGVKRILALSTPAWLSEADPEALSWYWWFVSKFPEFFIPQGNKEMYEIARRVTEEGESGGWGLQWTVFRVPHLSAGTGDERVSAGFFGHGFVGTAHLSRKSLVRWVLNEIEVGEWINKTPMLGNY
ncbi:hypothetical protein DV738_g3166, partial [Chaetothyriales sp. CBS 135597]